MFFQADGWLSWCESEADRVRYVELYESVEGISLNPALIQRNEGLRALSKLMANSHWGKYGEKSVRSQLTYVEDPAEFITLMSDKSIEVQDLAYVNDEHVALKWTLKEDFDEGLSNVNVVLAAYTTCHARLKLYELLEGLKERVLYFDTDSVVYVSREGLWDPPLGDYLGELKDETKGVPIVRFVSGGPKNYAYELRDGSSVCKIRGFTLNHRTSLKLNFDTLRNMMVTGARDVAVETEEPHRLVREADGAMYTKGAKKKYRMVYDKRYVDVDGVTTFPYGWNPS